MSTLSELRTLATFGAFLPRNGELPRANGAVSVGEALAGAVTQAAAGTARTAVALSGGVDSTVVALLAAGQVREAWVMDLGGAVESAQRVARELGLRLHVVQPPTGGVLETPVRDVVAALGHPTHSAAPFAFLPLYRAMAAAGVERVLTGDGADELFGGHAYHRARHLAFEQADSRASFWSAYSSLRGVAEQVELDGILGETRRPGEPWENSEYAQAVFEGSSSLVSAPERLRFVDVAVRMRPQCVDLQGALCAYAGLRYAAPIADRAVVAAALAEPVGFYRDHGKQALRALARARLGARWSAVSKDPIHSQNGRRTSSGLPTEWRELLCAERCEEHGVFDASAVEDRVRSLRAEDEWLPRSLMVVATTHAWIEQSA